MKSGRMGRFDNIEAEEKYRLIRAGLSQGLSDCQTALYAGCSNKTVSRYREKHGIPNVYQR